MPANRAAKKAAAKHADPKHHEAKDLRRAYEHLGRVEILQHSLGATSAKEIHTLVTLAEKELGKGHRKDAADLLRAAEHFSFAALAAEATSGNVSDELKGIVAEEVDHLTEERTSTGAKAMKRNIMPPSHLCFTPHLKLLRRRSK